MKNLLFYVGGGTLLLLLFFGTAFTTYEKGLDKNHGAPYWTDSAISKEGQELFQRAGCYACHSYLGQQGQVTGPSFDTLGDRMDQKTIQYFIYHGTEIMPAYKDKLTEQEINTLAEWLSTFKAENQRKTTN